MAFASSCVRIATSWLSADLLYPSLEAATLMRHELVFAHGQDSALPSLTVELSQLPRSLLHVLTFAQLLLQLIDLLRNRQQLYITYIIAYLSYPRQRTGTGVIWDTVATVVSPWRRIFLSSGDRLEMLEWDRLSIIWHPLAATASPGILQLSAPFVEKRRTASSSLDAASACPIYAGQKESKHS